MKSESPTRLFVIGLISDTHGEVPSAAIDALRGADHLIHAGDILGRSVLADLGAIAPVTAVRGNMDRGGGAPFPPETQYTEVSGLAIYVIHDILRLDIDPPGAGVDIVVHGHTHRASAEWVRGVLYINPGSAAQPRGGPPASVAKIFVTDKGFSPEFIRLG